ncbi:MAG TPA: spermidine/putrescine ABC transporter substrate-binding protein [Candidatus Limnocylindrales bacterium]|jgi:spermidine/putrescine transport system substrate-binding protein|nr:spermidine/putrescine ABC transporter substrate-binding protein [Candidatus Limnocylindrales bacterium]
MTIHGLSLRLTAILAVLALALTACGGTATASPSPTTADPGATDDDTAPTDDAEPTDEAPAGRIVVSNWDGYMPDDLLDNFTAETGIEVELALHTTNEDIMGKLEAANGGGFDVVFVSAPFAEVLNRRGWAAQLDHSAIPNLANLYPEASELDYDPGNAFSVPYAWGTTGLCYRTDLVDEEIDSWADLLQPSADLQGKITMLATDRWLLLPAQKLLGHSINTTDEAELNEARDLLIEAKQSLLAYDDTTFYSRLVSGEAVLVEAWDGWCNYGIAEDPNIGWVIPEEGSDLWVDTMVVLESSENKAGAQAFIDYVLRPDVGAWVAENILYKVPNAEAMESLDPELIEAFPNLGMTAEELFEGEVMRDVGDALPIYTRIVSEVTAS